jgi:endo-1,4-beta-D-glucanase Y
MRNRRLLLPVSLSRVALGAGLVVAGIAASPSVNAQQLGGAFPFPSTNLDASRFKTDAITTYELEDLYRKWVTDTVRSCGNDLRILYTENNPQDTRSEGIGYGMVIAAYMGDQATFEGLWSFYQRHSSQGLMNWLLNDCNTVGDVGSAADADIDAALGLIVADKQFPNQGYANDARTLLNAVRTRLVEPANRGGNCNGVLLPGSNYSGCGCVNPSYIPPGYYAAYAAFDTANAASWNNARTASYTLLAQAQNDATGFVPAWSTSTGSTQLQNCAFQVAGGGGPDEYQSDAARTPWRVATDYAWTGDTRAAQFLDVLNGFVTGLPRVRIIDRYSLQGQGLGENVASAFGRRGSFHMGGFATAMIASSQEDLDSFTGAWNSVYRAGDLINGQTLRAYNGSLALLYALLVTGTMWNPTGPNPAALPEPALPDQGANILANGDFTAGLRGWTTQSLSNPAEGDDSDGYMVHKAGEIHARVLKIQATRAYGIQFYQDVSLQAGQNYLVSLKARAAAPRPVRLVIGEVGDFDNNGQQFQAYAILRDGDADTFDVSTADATYSFVFTQPVTNPGVRVSLQFGDATDEVIFDDVSITPTDLPPTEVVDVEGGEPVTPGSPGTPTTPGGTPTTPAGMDGTIGTVNPNGDTPGSTGTPGAPGAPDPNGSTAGLPAAPTTPPGAGSCTAANPTVCAPAACSVELGLCYDPGTGYVWSPTQNTYTQPPRGVQGCAADQVYWPKFGFCYIPETGWIYNRGVMQWQFYGIDYTEGKRPPGDAGGCSVSGGVGRESGSHWLLMGLLGAALGLTYRRRAA